MKVNQEEVTTAIAAGRSVAQGDDTEAAEATVRLARRAGPDAVKFLRHFRQGGMVRVCRRKYVQRAHCWRSAVFLAVTPRPKPGPPQRSGDRPRPTAAPTRAKRVNTGRGAPRGMARASEIRSAPRQMAGACLHILDRNRSGGGIGDQRRDAQEARR